MGSQKRSQKVFL